MYEEYAQFTVPFDYKQNGGVVAGGGRWGARGLCYTEFVLKNMTITVSEEAAHWARKKAAEENTSVSKLVGRMLEDQMRRNDDYWKAYEQWKKLQPIPGLDAAHRLTREEANERRR